MLCSFLPTTFTVPLHSSAPPPCASVFLSYPFFLWSPILIFSPLPSPLSLCSCCRMNSKCHNLHKTPLSGCLLAPGVYVHSNNHTFSGQSYLLQVSQKLSLNLTIPSAVTHLSLLSSRCAVRGGGDVFSLCRETLLPMFLLSCLWSTDLPPVLGVEWRWR